MGRRIKDVTITAEGRDQGRTYRITEMTPVQAEKWSARALLAMSRAGVDISDDVVRAGFAGIAAVGVRALTGMSFAEAEPLLDEMMTCVQFIPSGGVVRPLIADDIDEVRTLLTLREEIIELHTGFSIAAALSSLGAAAKTGRLSKRTSTSRKRSAPSSPPA